jgi:hypothetical protein
MWCLRSGPVLADHPVRHCEMRLLCSEGDTMPNDAPLQTGTLIIIAIVVLALLFAGIWIDSAANASSNPSALLPWFAAATGIIIVIALVAYGVRRSGRNGQ